MTNSRSRYYQFLRCLGRGAFSLAMVVSVTASVLGQTQTPTPDQRGLGVKGTDNKSNSPTDQLSREAKPELVLQTGYNNLFGATRLVFSPDGRLLATATFRSSTIKLWETATGRELRDLSTGTQSVVGMAPFVAFSPDGRLLAAAAGDNSVKIWDVITGRELQSLAGSQGSLASSLGVSFIGFAAGGQVVTVSDAVKVWDLASGSEVRNLGATEIDAAGFTGNDGGVVLSADGTQLAQLITEDSRPEIKFTEVASGKVLRTVNLPDKDFFSAQIFLSPDGRAQVAAIMDKQLKLLDPGGRAGERNLSNTLNEYSPVKFSVDGRQVWLVENYVARRWDTATGQELSQLKLPNGGILSGQPLAFISTSNDGKKAATGGFDTPTILWDLETGKQLLKMNGRTNMAYKVRFNADGSQLTSGGRTRWDLRTGRGLRLTSAPVDGVIDLPSPDGHLLATYGPNNNVVSIVETPSGRQVQKLVSGASGSVVQRASFSSDGTLLVVAYGPGADSAQKTSRNAQSVMSESQTKIWEVKTGREVTTLTNGLGVSDVGFSSDGRILATIGTMGGISLWDSGSGSKLRDLSSSPIDKLAGLEISEIPEPPVQSDLARTQCRRWRKCPTWQT